MKLNYIKIVYQGQNYYRVLRKVKFKTGWHACHFSTVVCCNIVHFPVALAAGQCPSGVGHSKSVRALRKDIPPRALTRHSFRLEFPVSFFSLLITDIDSMLLASGIGVNISLCAKVE